MQIDSYHFHYQFIISYTVPQIQMFQKLQMVHYHLRLKMFPLDRHLKPSSVIYWNFNNRIKRPNISDSNSSVSVSDSNSSVSVQNIIKKSSFSVETNGFTIQKSGWYPSALIITNEFIKDKALLQHLSMILNRTDYFLFIVCYLWRVTDSGTYQPVA